MSITKKTISPRNVNLWCDCSFQEFELELPCFNRTTNVEQLVRINSLGSVKLYHIVSKWNITAALIGLEQTFKTQNALHTSTSLGTVSFTFRVFWKKSHLVKMRLDCKRDPWRRPLQPVECETQSHFGSWAWQVIKARKLNWKQFVGMKQIQLAHFCSIYGFLVLFCFMFFLNVSSNLNLFFIYGRARSYPMKSNVI